MSKLIPAILTDDPADLEKKIRALEKISDEAHIDFMDGEFVNTVSVPPESLIATNTKITLEAHLMVKRPDLFVAPFQRTTVRRIIFHADAVDNVDFLIRLFKDEGFTVGLAINPETTVDSIVQHLQELELVHFLTVDPGKQGNPFQGEVLPKIRTLRETWFSGTISVDGGIKKENIAAVAKSGADRLIVGSALWQSHDPAKTFRDIKQTLNDTSL